MIIEIIILLLCSSVFATLIINYLFEKYIINKFKESSVNNISTYISSVKYKLEKIKIPEKIKNGRKKIEKIKNVEIETLKRMIRDEFKKERRFSFWSNVIINLTFFLLGGFMTYILLI